MTLWVRNGTVSVTNGSAVVTGTGTTWADNRDVVPGHAFRGPDGKPYEVLSIASNTSLTLAENYTGTTASGQNYSIVPVPYAFVKDVVDRVNALITRLTGTVEIPSLRVGSPTIVSGVTAAFRGLSHVFENATNLYIDIYKGAAANQAWLRWWSGANQRLRIGTTTADEARFDIYDDTLTNKNFLAVGVDGHPYMARGVRIPETAAAPSGAGDGSIWSHTSGKLRVRFNGVDEYVITRTTSDLITREVLQASRTYYVRTDGNDSNDGLTNTSGGAFLTLQAAENAARKLDLNSYAVTVQLGAGTFSGGGTFTPKIGVSSLSSFIVKGIAGATIVKRPSGDTNPTLYALNGAFLVVSDLIIEHDAVSGAGIQAAYNSVVSIQANVVFGDCGANGTLILCRHGSVITLANNISVTNSYRYFFSVYFHGRIDVGAITITATTPVTVGVANVASTGMGYYQQSATWSGTFTGKRYVSEGLSVVDVVGAGASAIGGTVAGTVATGGQYF